LKKIERMCRYLMVDDSPAPAAGLVLPGSMPAEYFESDSTAMQWVLEQTKELPADKLPYLCTGETRHPRDRTNWCIPMVDALRNHPDLRVAKEGHWAPGYDDFPRFDIVPGHKFNDEFINPGVWNNYADDLAEYMRLCADAGHRGENWPAMLLGVKSDFDLGIIVFGRIRGLFFPQQYREPFTRATAADITRVHRDAGSHDCEFPTKVVFQLECPMAAIGTASTHPALRWWMAARAGRGVVQVVKSCPPQARIGIHPCWGDKEHHAAIRPRNAAPLVQVVNNAAAAWPKNHRAPEYIHLPLAFGDVAPPLREEFYAPLANLRVNPATRIVAGFLHEDLTDQQLRTVYGWVNRHVSLARHATGVEDPVLVGPACGLGRRDLDAAQRVIGQGVMLCADPAPVPGSRDGDG
jgi:hypothetical protein